MSVSVQTGPDGRARCAWAGAAREGTDAAAAAIAEEYRRYHDEEWGRPLHGDRALFEKLSLEGFQAGLSWITILRKRPRFREVFAGFDPAAVAAFTEVDVARLMADPGIVRNRAKIEATIANARLVAAMAPGELDALLWSFAPASAPASAPVSAPASAPTSAPKPAVTVPGARRRRPAALAEIPAVTAESEAMSKALRRRGFRFVGPTTMYALMQSTGMVDDHVDGCWRAIG